MLYPVGQGLLDFQWEIHAIWTKKEWIKNSDESEMECSLCRFWACKFWFAVENAFNVTSLQNVK